MILTKRDGEGNGEVNLAIQAVIRKKILFSTRPTPLNLKGAKAGSAAAAGQNSLGEKRRNLN